MEAQGVWAFVHVMLLVYWLGADLGVFYTAHQVIKPELSAETRAALLKVLTFVDGFPRAVSIFMLPVGLQLAAGLGLSPVIGGWLWTAWIAAVLWFLIAYTANTQRATATGQTLAKIDLAIRAVLLVVLAVAAIFSFVGEAPFATNWLALKVLLFALLLVCGIGIRVTFAPFGPAFAELVADGSSPETEAVLKRAVGRAVPFVIALWVLLGAEALIGIAQPYF
ncbi:MAG TPA: hypothetical protein QF665_02565 [Alphaproteobacteria bacterium]|nr:hypothetical protein [Alphaproteobacteria bacterium]